MIGVFDSGIGGLSVVSRLRTRQKDADILYFADLSHSPFGKKRDATIRRYAEAGVKRLILGGADKILFACGTLSAVALPEMRFPVPVFGIIEAGADTVRGERIAVLATEATVRSHAYRDAIFKRTPTAKVLEIACPELVTLAERGEISLDSEAVHAALFRRLSPLFSFHPDAILLGCTHFPLFSEAIARFCPGVPLFSAGDAAADAFPADKGHGRTVITASRSSRVFRNAAAAFGSAEIRIDHEKIKDNM